MKRLENKNTSAWAQLWSMERSALKRIASAGLAKNGGDAGELASIAGNGDGIRTIDPANFSGAAGSAEAPPPYRMRGSAAVIPLIGPITKYPNWFDSICGWCFTLDIQAAIEAALDDDDVEKVILFIDSPGGMLSGTPDLADFIANNKMRKPIVAYVSDLCASGAYWVASQCSSIIANASAFVGSIGVYQVLADTSKAAEECGVQIVLVSDGEFKGLNEPGLPVGDKAITEAQRTVAAAGNLFRNAVASGRGLGGSVVIQLADGRIHVAGEAMGLGLIDEIGTLDAAINFEGSRPEGKMATHSKIKAAADGQDGATGGDGSTPDLAEVCSKILDGVNALTEMVKALAEDDTDGAASADDAGSGSAEDASAKALSGDRDRLKAIMAACPGREKFASEQFLAGKTAIEAKAALADVLGSDLAEAKKKIAAGEDGADPIAGVQPQGGGARAANASDPEQVWEKNLSKVQAAYHGRKDRFLVAWKHGQTPVQIAAKNAAAVAAQAAA